LKRNSITAYNDATLEYFDVLIEEERHKAKFKGNNGRLHALVEDRRKYEDTVEILTYNIANHADCQPLDEERVDRLVKQLHNLKHFGKTFATAYST
jgi:DNA repair ATPase RecN